MRMTVQDNVEELVAEARIRTHAKNNEEALIIVFRDWLAEHPVKTPQINNPNMDEWTLQELNEEIRRSPLQFQESFTAQKVRELNRNLP
ncbi:MAG: hypothetical protein WCK42_07135 [Myxococcaceae bacterium]